MFKNQQIFTGHLLHAKHYANHFKYKTKVIVQWGSYLNELLKALNIVPSM